MLYPTLSQPLVFLYLLLAGLASGLIYEFCILLTKTCQRNSILKQVFLFLATIASAVVFWLVNLAVNYGEFRIYALLTFITAIIFERITLGKVFAILSQKCYNALNGRKEKKKTD